MTPLSTGELDLLTKIVDRWEALLPHEKQKQRPRQARIDDLATCHNGGTRLNLQHLLDADIDTFLHDVDGIERHIDRRTGKLELFRPRTC